MQATASNSHTRTHAAPPPPQAPDTLVNDLTLDALARLRPVEAGQLRLVSGMGEAAVEAFGEPLMRVRAAARWSSKGQGAGRKGTLARLCVCTPWPPCGCGGDGA